MRRSGVTAAAAVLVVIAAGCSGTDQADTAPGTGRTPRTGDAIAPAGNRPSNPLAAVSGPLVIAVGDIACAPGRTVTTTTCRHRATARQAKRYAPRRALVLGDSQYDDGSLYGFRHSYDRTWGALKSVTRPVPGNHEYHTAAAAGYYRYFRGRQPGPPGYYAFDVGRWRVYALNSNCTVIDCAAEARWLDRAMTARRTECSLIMLHHPLYSSGREHGNSPEGRRFWRIALRHGTDLALAGHDHDYERFQRMDADGHVIRDGIASFVVGTGGKSLYHQGERQPGSVVFDNHRAGVLALRLGPHRYGWRFRTIDGRLVDQGKARCR